MSFQSKNSRFAKSAKVAEVQMGRSIHVGIVWSRRCGEKTHVGTRYFFRTCRWPATSVEAKERRSSMLAKYAEAVES